MTPNLGYAIAGTIFAVIFVLLLKRGFDDPSYQPPDDPMERLRWQAEHGNGWAQSVLTLIHERHLLTQIVRASTGLLKVTGVDKSSPEYGLLDKAHHEYDEHIARTYNKEEC